MEEKPLIYYVEDDANIRDLTAYALRQAGLAVEAFPDGLDLLECCRRQRPAAVLLDIMLPEVDGLELLRQLRTDDTTATLPVMMLTAKGAEFDKVCGLDAGADDYLAKPFGMMELVSRVNALLRRAARPAEGAGAAGGAAASQPSAAGPAAQPPAPGALVAGPIALDPDAHIVEVQGVPVQLTLKEFDLLRVFMENTGRVLTRDYLLEKVWDVLYAGETRTVDMHVKTLRHKLAAAYPGAEAAIATVRGVGYRFSGFSEAHRE
ncbi:MAG: response regulator transcription factor [Adlercreutzia mucosicola]|nr:response regulator transcription factor [Adlercreutzia mucosicola]